MSADVMARMDEVTYLAPAKINLFLHVTARRPDGYHELQTLFQLIDWCDHIRVTRRFDGAIVRAYQHAGIDETDDLCVRAAQLMLREYQSVLGPQFGIAIELQKNIPIGAGLGGGSSDAAAVMLAINQLAQLQRPRADLARLALSLGADVPVFVMRRNAFAQGVGEDLREITLAARFFVVIFPNVMVPTAQIFSAPALVRSTPVVDWGDVVKSPFDFGHNDLAPVACAIYPELQAVARWLGQFHQAEKNSVQVSPARMSGSGAAFFAVCTDESIAQKIVAQCHQERPQWTCRLARSWFESDSKHS